MPDANQIIEGTALVAYIGTNLTLMHDVYKDIRKNKKHIVDAIRDNTAYRTKAIDINDNLISYCINEFFNYIVAPGSFIGGIVAKINNFYENNYNHNRAVKLFNGVMKNK